MRINLVLAVLLGLATRESVVRAQAPQPGAAGGESNTVAEIARRATPATVTILALGPDGDTLATGSGFLASVDGAVITCWHVLQGAARAAVVLSTAERYERVSVLDADSALDVAVLKIPGYGLPFLTARSSVPGSGEEAIAIGSPLGLSLTVSTGIVSASRLLNGRDLVQVTTPISPGSSGGPILDEQGHVFAIADMYISGGQQLNFAVPVRYAMGLLADAHSQRSVNEVFGGTGRVHASRDAVATQPASRDTPTPSRTTSPVSSLSSTYLIAETVMSAGRSGTASGFLVPTEFGGWMMLRLDSDSTSQISVFYVNALRTNSSGAVTLDVGGMAFDGYQTDSGGFYLTGTLLDSAARSIDSVSLNASPYTPPLSNPNGQYQAAIRTNFTRHGLFVSANNWQGALAAVVANDTIHVVLHLVNDVGGSSGIYAEGRLASDSSFDLEVRGRDGASSELRGLLRAGVITGEWIEKREGGAEFKGPFRATRQ